MNTPVPFADVLQDKILRRIATIGEIRQYPAQTVLIHEGEQTDALFILLNGQVKVYSAISPGKEVVLAIHGAGEFVGELALDGSARSASVVTLRHCTCSVVSGADLRRIIVSRPEFALHLIYELIQRLRESADRVKSLSLQDVYARIVKLLMKLAQPRGDLMIIPERMTQRDLAERVGSSREMISRVLKELQTGGYIDITNRRIRILKKPPSAW